MKLAKSVVEYFETQDKWAEILLQLREVLLSTEMDETVKWGAPAYTVDGKMVVGLVGFKNFAALWFHQGIMLSDPANKLINAQGEVTKAMRQWRFTSVDEIDDDLIRAYLEEAIRNQKEGRVVKPTRKRPLIIPPELQEVFEQDAKLKAKFDGMKLTFKREYVHYITSAKRDDTKKKRMDKMIPLIQQGISVYAKYKK